jgi:hypothetical protein
MKAYRKPSGVYLEVQDNTPVSTALVEVALRPSANHMFSDTWDSNPMDPAVCWRLKTAPELTTEKDTALQEFLDSPGGKVVKAIVQVGIDKGHWTLTELRTKYRSL